MALTIVSTPGASNANSYVETTEIDSYYEGRIELDPAWGDSDTSKEALVVMATRLIDNAFRGGKVLVKAQGGRDAYVLTRRKWNGTAATTTQRLAFPRIGLTHDNGAPLASNEIPWELKDAVAELAGQLGAGDRTLDNDVAVGGITSVKAGSVAVTFKDGYIDSFTLPQVVFDMIPASWYTEESTASPNGGLVFGLVAPSL